MHDIPAHRALRTMLNTAFTSANLRSYFPFFIGMLFKQDIKKRKRNRKTTD